MELQNQKNQNQFKKIAVVSDHRGENHIPSAVKVLETLGVEVVLVDYDHGTDNDYPDVIAKVKKLFQTGKIDGMIMLCGTGVGMCMGANKCKNVRCVWADSEALAAFGRIHEDANALAIGAGYASEELGLEIKMCKRKLARIIRRFVTTPFGGGRHARRVEKLNNLK